MAGHGFVALGVIGIFVPVMPTTPFLLVAAACYVRSSERHHKWLMDSPVCGPIIRDYHEKRGIRLRTKLLALALLWGSMAVSMWRAKIAWLDATLLAIGLFATIMILRVRTLRPSDSAP
jgi:uncharacterized membrane protein YbaN (DUF454 family)